MPPLYDNLNDAFELTGSGSVALDTTGATFEGNEATQGEGWEGVWMKIDLSAYPAGSTVPVSLDLGIGGGSFVPYVDAFKVSDPTFDPTAPDFTKLSFISGIFWGDGSADPSSHSEDFLGGTGSHTGARSESGIFYLILTDWNFATYGTSTIDYVVPAAPVCLDAVDIINPDCATASVVGGGTRVREDWKDWWDIDSNGYTREEMTLKLTWAEAAGLYQVKVYGQLSAASSGPGVVNAIVLVNGRPFLGVGGTGFTNTTPGSIDLYNGFDAGTPDVYDPSDRGVNPWVPLTPGDLVEIQIMSHADLSGFAGFNPFECSQICFILDPGDTTFCTGAANFGDVPLGDDWGDEDGWGGQRLIPDEVYAALGYTPDSHTPGVQFPWGVRWTDFDMVPLEDGTVYFIIHDSFTTGASPPSSDSHWVVVKKYDPGSDTWTQVATLAAPTGRKPAESVSCEYDGTYVYFAWWECTTYTAGIPSTYQSDWHLVKMDPSDDSYVELGTGQHAVTVGTGATDQTDNAEIFFGAVLAPKICFSGSDVYVGAVELVRTAAGSSGVQWRRPFIWKWNGSWANLNIPAPTEQGPDTTKWEISGENGFWDQLIQMVASDQDGPITDGITVVYSYVYRHADTTLHKVLETIPYTTGGGWGTEILSDIYTLEGSFLTGSSAGYTMLIDHTVMWSEKLGKLVLVGDHLLGSSGNNWNLYQMNDAGDQWEKVESLAPASSAADWRQSRQSADIGPDGDVWRGMMADTVSSGFNFEPHVVKHSPEYSFGFANGSRKPIGRIAPWTDPQSNVWGDGLFVQMDATTNVRIRWVGTACYMALNLAVEPKLTNGQDFDTYAGFWPTGDGFYVIKATYQPCSRFLPQFYRRVLG